MRRLAGFLPLVYVLLFAYLLIGPLWAQTGIPNTADGLLHLHRSAAMARSWGMGVVWPRWFPDVYQGLGAPTFHYYGPLFYLMMAPLHLLGLTLDLSAKVVISCLFVLSGWATWAWLRRLFGSIAALAGVPFYLGQASLFREYYVQGDYPQLVALYLLPVVFWAFTRLYQESGWLDRLLAPVSLALVIVAHNITAMIGSGVLVLYSLGVLWQQRWAGWLRGVLAAVWTLGLSAFFWLPSLADMGLVRAENLRLGMFDYRQNFVPWLDLLAAPPLLDSRAANPPFPHLLGWAAWLALAGGALTFLVSLITCSGQGANRRWIATGLGIAAICLALTQTWTAPLWETIPLLPLVLFPSRFLGPAALGVALTASAAIAAYRESRQLPLTLAAIAAVALTSSVFLFPQGPFLSISFLSAADTQAYERQAHVWGMTSANPFLPRWAGLPEKNAGLAAQADLPDQAHWFWETPHRAVLQAFDSPLPVGALVLPAHYFPAWEVTADGEILSVWPTADGRVNLELVRPAQEVVLYWAGTTWQKTGAWISLISLVAWLAWIGQAVWCDRHREGIARSDRAGLGKQWLAALVLLVVLILARETIQKLTPGWFQLRSPPGEVSRIAHRVNQALGGNEQPTVTLLGWELLPSPLKAGSTLRLRLVWQSQGRIKQDLHSLLQLYTPSQRRGWVGVQNDAPGGIPTSGWHRDLYYVDDLTLQLPEDLPPIAYTLAVGMVDDEGQRLEVAGNPDNLVFLGEVQIKLTRAGWCQRLRPAEAVPALFGQDLRLQGYDLVPDPGGPILRLFWEVEHTPGLALTTFVHLVDDQRTLVAQFDAPPLQGLLPTTQWPAGALLIDRQKLVLPEGLDSGQYRLLVGLYDPDTGARLPVQPEGDVSEHFDQDALIVPLYVPP